MTIDPAFYLALDVGTHAVKAALVDSSGCIGAVESCTVSLKRLSERRVEQSPNEILEALEHVVKAVLGQSSVRVAAAGLATQRSTVLAWDKTTGAALSEALSWQDTREYEQINSLVNSGPIIEQLSGLVVSPHYGASKIHALQQKHSGANVCISPLVSYLIFHLLDNQLVSCDESNAGRTQLWNLDERCWDARLCAFFNVDPTILPSVQPVLSEYGAIKPSWVHGKEVPLRAVAGDQNAALSAVLSQNSQALLVNIGSGAFVLGFDQEETAKPRGMLQSIAYSDEEAVCKILEGTVNGAGLALSWFAQTPEVEAFGGEPWLLGQLHQWLDQEFDHAYFYNFVGGLGSPFWLSGIESRFEPENALLESKAVAIIESIVFLLVINAKIILKRNTKGVALYVSGGVSKFDGLCQRMANLMKCKVIRGQGHQATLLGTARLASNFAIPIAQEIERVFVPKSDPSLHDRFNKYFSTMKKNEYNLVAHRGYAEKFPENSLQAMVAALDAGVKAVEFDIQISSDGIPVVFHDAELMRLSGSKGKVSEFTFEELQALSVHEANRFGQTFFPSRIPALEDVVSLIKAYPDAVIFAEIKEEIFLRMNRMAALQAIWQRLKPIAKQCKIISFDLEILRLVQKQSLCSVGWVLTHYNQFEYEQISSNPVDIVICNQKRFPNKGQELWLGPWDWFAYEISSKAMLVDCLERGVKWIESRDPVSLL